MEINLFSVVWFISIKFLFRFSKYNFSDNEKAIEFITKLAHVNYTSLTSLDLPEFNEIDSKDYIKYIVEFAFVFEPSVSNSGATGDQYQLEKTITELGICYSFNSQLARYSAPE